MSILIRGMEMPTSCFDCPFMYQRRYCRCNTQIEFNDPDYSELKGRYEGCPLIPVPKHGRLIDADALENEHMKRASKDFRSFEFHVTAIAWVNEAPTIIPAEQEA